MSITRRQCLVSASLAVSVPLWRSSAAAAAGEGDVPWLDEAQSPPAALPDDAPKLSDLLIDDAGRPITTLEQWQERRRAIRQWWSEFLGTVRPHLDPPTLRVIEEDRPDGVIRQLVRYETEPGIEVQAYLLRPADTDGKVPGVVALHSTVNHTIRQPAGLEDRPEVAFGLKLAKAGCAAFCPMCFLWVGEGDYNGRVAAFEKRHPGAKGMAKMLHDARRAVDVLLTLPYVDANRIGAVGHSLGAKESLYLAAFDERVKVTVSSEGGIGTRFSNWEAPWYLGPTIREPGFTHEHHELLGLIAPRPFLLLGGDSADGERSWPFITATMPVYRLYDSGRRPRLGLYNHRMGHSVPAEAEKRIAQWFEAYL